MLPRTEAEVVGFGVLVVGAAVVGAAVVGAVVVVPQWLVVGGATELPGATELVGAEVLEFGNVVSTHGAVVGTAVEGALEDGPAVVGAAEVLAEAV